MNGKGAVIDLALKVCKQRQFNRSTDEVIGLVEAMFDGSQLDPAALDHLTYDLAQ